MKRQLSSLQTFLFKIIFPAIWIPMFGLGAVVMFFTPSDGKSGSSPGWFFLLLWIAGSAFIFYFAIRLKEVSVDYGFLYVSNYLKTVKIPLSQIYDVTEIVWINIHPVTIHLRSPSEFGTKIVFMPTMRYFAFFSSHPVVAELKQMAGTKRWG
ncbi:MAG TPA: hypothetical protein VGQ55_07665 [Pyrinomonadaceae bacterium]|nr:hypothetical protein [Pyrinomonadaceae bacterium]